MEAEKMILLQEPLLVVFVKATVNPDAFYSESRTMTVPAIISLRVINKSTWRGTSWRELPLDVSYLPNHGTFLHHVPIPQFKHFAGNNEVFWVVVRIVKEETFHQHYKEIQDGN